MRVGSSMVERCPKEAIAVGSIPTRPIGGIAQLAEHRPVDPVVAG